MNLAQLHYTSAPPGPDGSGFRFTAVSPGAPVSLLREAEQLIGYEPPRDAPDRPTDEQLASFPEALSLSVLSDGSRLLARSVYTGADYSGRWGNFHTHAVHLPQPADSGPARGALPITSWGSPQWASDTPPGGPPAPLEKVPAPGRYDAAGLAEFVAARRPWLAGFFADVRRLAEDPAAPQVVLVERDSTAVARWIMLACSVLPHQRGQWLTFTTYTRRPLLARHRIIGVLPEDGAGLGGQDHRYRLYDSTRAPDADPRPGADPGAGTGSDAGTGSGDVWADTAARVWPAGRHELFAEVRRLPPGRPYDAGPLAALALAAGITLDSAGRTAAAEWAADHRTALDEGRLHALAEALARPVGDRSPAETAACGRLLAALDGRGRPAAYESLVALALTEAVRGAGAPPPVGALGAATRGRLAAELGPQLRAALADPEREPGERAGLLRVAAAIGVDATDLMPEVARKLALALLAEPERAYGEGARAALTELPALRHLLLNRLNAFAVGDPAAGVRVFARTGLRLRAADPVQYLHMCAAAPEVLGAATDRVAALHALVERSGSTVYADPLVLRTGMRLVWEGEPPSAAEAALLLSTTGAAPHVEAGTCGTLARAAVRAPADDAAAAELAPKLLEQFRTELPEPLRPSLLLLELARNLRAGTAGPGWVRMALDLRSLDPEPGPRDHAYAAVAARLLGEDRTEGELRALIESNDVELLAAYRRLARDPAVLNRLRRSPRYLADCFTAWSSQPQAGPVWQEARTDLLDRVLRPVVRGLGPAESAAVEEELNRLGGRWAEEFRAWQRPGAFGRLRDRLKPSSRRRPPPPDPAGPAPSSPPDAPARPDGPAGGDWAGVTPRAAGSAVPARPSRPPATGGPVRPGGSDGDPVDGAAGGGPG
ncbi:GTPase-associated protein 1-related protein [Streptomyces sp. NPDC102278]|uniref:GTPase-associated protein 1-related protein n=1 Tax=Streptomyces sp. NPDC102278 TaxID=3366152 RepID=UPI00382B8751